MNQDRFLELLNLYLDDEISPEELAALMEETRRDPDRQRVYLDYCRIHKACGQIGSKFQSRPARRTIRQTVYALGGLAAAFALLALAGRNLVPFFEGQAGQAVAVEQATPQSSGPVFFPEVATTEVLAPRFVAGGEEPRIRFTDENSNRRLVLSSDSLFEKNHRSFFDFKREEFFAKELLEALNAQSKRSASLFDRLGVAGPIELTDLPLGLESGFSDQIKLNGEATQVSEVDFDN